MRIIVLFNLKPGVSVDTYEKWARETDIPGVRAMKSVSAYHVQRATGILGTEDASPYAYIEIIEVGDVALFGKEAAEPVVQALAADMRNYADNPIFITSDAL
jgi:REDY-like protein HapK